ncbi:hypothetical protein CLV59_11332 [Chitinophaga dinghuensis]|uniref:Uncharacterized protein n=1 Tax=Chitinophaga dinghuensis TaxID=1539050 RepID=A0A327VKT3_9BACT|nr:hypothetical protein CLV59_11332 [Chitinophaga dinghuensis]
MVKAIGVFLWDMGRPHLFGTDRLSHRLSIL